MPKKSGLKIAMLGAGSGFVISIARELTDNPVFDHAEFVLMDIAADRLEASLAVVKDILKDAKNHLSIVATTDRQKALKNCDYVVSSCEKSRYANWVTDFRIPETHGVRQLKAENGGPGGLIHGMRNICLYREILEDMARWCPDAWLLNFSNPMSILCTYFKNYSKIRCLGFCHQVHGSFGVIAEELGMEPGELEVVSAGINHLNWLFDIRRRGTNRSFMNEFLGMISDSRYWKQRFPHIPSQVFTKLVLDTFGMYPIGYDDHIVEYLPFFWEKNEWGRRHIKSLRGAYEKMVAEKTHGLEQTRLLGRDYVKPPFPKDPDHPYYAENPCRVITAFETNTPAYFDAINIRNNGAVGNLPDDVILDVPGIAIGGEVRSVHVGDLPPGPREICRRQTVLHEMIAEAAHNGDDLLAVQALCLDPYVHSITQARNIWADFREAYKVELTTFTKPYKA